MNNFFKRLVLNIHTILLFVGIGFVSVSAFLYSEKIGFLVLGISLITVSLIINRDMG